MAATDSETIFERRALRLQVRVMGAGRPLLVLHDEMGYPGEMAWQTELARSRQLHVPLAPGFGIAPRIEWVDSMRDLACVYGRWLREDKLAPIDVLGFSLGGWLAAEMLANDPGLFRRALLVAPLGIKPSQGVILDAYELSHREHLKATVAAPQDTPEFAKLYGGAPTPAQIEAFDDARAESARLAWQPYMHNPSLPYLLDGLAQRVPTALVWGERDAVVPRSAMQSYVEALGQAQLHVIADSGHRSEIERSAEFLAIAREFFR
jgi:pimeloyl-ACP methyl ester carboxylesterase